MIDYMFDTTFILPYCQINVAIDSINLYLEKLQDLFMNQGKKIVISSCSFLEAKWKAIALEKKDHVTGLLESTNQAIDSLANNNFYEIIYSESIASIHSLADSLLKLGHKDYMDCLIFATAKYYNFKIVTADSELSNKIVKFEFWNDLKILKWNNFIQEVNLKI